MGKLNARLESFYFIVHFIHTYMFMRGSHVVLFLPGIPGD